ncbi:MAG: hypothetical protein WA842_09230 [Croceibacterium sp.]
MRRLLPALVASGLSLCLLPLPAAAQDTSLDQAADLLADRRVQDGVANAAAAMADSMLDLKVGGLVRAMRALDPGGPDARQVDPDTTLGEVAGPDAHDTADKLADHVPETMDRLADVAGGLGAMVPQLREMIERLRYPVDR